MSGLATAIITGVTAFSATNIDDLVILMLFFSQVDATFRYRHVVIGQYLGFSALVIASLPGFFGSLIVPHDWIKLLGFMPIVIGFSRLLNQGDSSSAVSSEIGQSKQPKISSFLSPQTYNVAAVAFVNGSDNVGIYVPLFASSTLENLLVILGIFFLLVGVWCYAAYQLNRLPTIVDVLSRSSNTLFPFILIGLGTFIVTESGPLTLLTLVTSYLFWMFIDKQSGHEVLSSPRKE